MLNLGASNDKQKSHNFVTLLCINIGTLKTII